MSNVTVPVDPSLRHSGCSNPPTSMYGIMATFEKVVEGCKGDMMGVRRLQE
jgi:hypothetical protein